MENVGHKYATRSMAKSTGILTEDFDRKVKSDLSDDNEEEIESLQLPNESMRLLRQLLAQQSLLNDDNKQLRKEIGCQQKAINGLAEALETMKIDRETNTKSSPSTTLNLVSEAAKQLQAKRIHRLLDSAPFTGSASQEVSDWVEEFTRKCDQLRLDDAQRLSVVADLLTENAKLWYETHKDTLENWVSLRTKLMNHFQLVTGTDQFQLEQKLYSRRRQVNEAAIDYCHIVMKLCSKVNQIMDEESRVRHLKKGLDSATQRHMDLKDPQNTEEFLEALIKYDKWQEEEIAQRNGVAAVDPRMNPPTRFIQRLIPPHGQGTTNVHHQYGDAQQQLTQQRRSVGAEANPSRIDAAEKRYTGCWSCGGVDHYRSNCPKNC